MYRTRSERLHAERKKKRHKSRWLIMLSGLFIVIALVMAAYLSDMSGSEKQTGEGGAVGTQQPIQAAPQPDNNEAPTVRLTFVGDTIMTGHVETLLKEKGYDFPYAYVNPLFTQDDVTVANLETPITNQGIPASNKEFVYKSPPEAVPAMRAAGIDLVNLANNHSMDQGIEGLLDTFLLLDQNEIAYVGAGHDATRAFAPVIVERNGVKLAFFGFSRVVPEVSWYAGKNKPGIAVSYDPKLAVEAIRAAREQADLVVVIAHWGKEREDYPVDHQKELARAYIDAGADLIIGGHPHVLQGFESYKDKWIAYSLGNFIFTRASEPKTWETMVLQATCTKIGNCQVKMLPYYAELGQAVPMNEQDGAKLRERVESISTGVKIESDGSVQRNEEI